MNGEDSIRTLLERLHTGECSVDEAIASLRSLPFEDLDFAKVDHHRALRKGFPEAIYCEGKTPDQVVQIFSKLAGRNPRVIGTRADENHGAAVTYAINDARYDTTARIVYLDRAPDRPPTPGVTIVAAGTSDLPVACEAALTAKLMGHDPEFICDVGVAGLHRVLHHLDALHSANAIIAVAGMEGALPSVVAGLVSAPVIAVPTSIGYGASFNGIAALLGMLNSCAPGVSVVNIDNGYGAAHLAATINAQSNRAAHHPGDGGSATS